MTYISSLRIPRSRQNFPRAITILGSTGSIGTNALQIIAAHPQKFQVIGLAGARNIRLLAKQAEQFRPSVLGVLTGKLAKELKTLLPGNYSPNILVGSSGYEAMAEDPAADFILSAQVGAAGLAPTLAAAQEGKVICLANKESLVMAGHLIQAACQKNESVILPVDSEHNAIFQCLGGHNPKTLRRILLTASGGPFRTKSRAFIETVTPTQALNHPNWSMGAKISIDSATLMNKGLEVIEAHHLFGIEMETIEVVVHPQSIIHSMVEYRDGSILAHLGTPNMKIPIGYCMAYPQRIQHQLEPLDFAKIAILSFEKPKNDMFPCLNLAYKALQAGPSYPVVLNAANEIAVQAFLHKQIPFLAIPRIIEKALEHHQRIAMDCLDAILDLDSNIRQHTQENIRLEY